MRLLLLSACLAAAAHAQAPLAWEPAPDAPGPLAARVFDYAYDDGAANVNIGPPSSFDPDMLWGNAFLTEPGAERITEIRVAFGGTFPSRDGGVTFWLLDDPDGDLDPRTGATAVASVTAVPTTSGNDFFSVPIPPTDVSGSFFVGASARLLGGQDRPARVDTGARADRSFFFYAPDIAAVIDSLGTAPFGTRMDDPATVPFPGAFMVRATGEPRTVASASAAPALAVALAAPAPNPVRGAATLRFALAAPSAARLDVLDALGRVVATPAAGAFGAGTHALAWDASALPAGVYAVRLEAGGAVRSVRAVVAR